MNKTGIVLGLAVTAVIGVGVWLLVFKNSGPFMDMPPKPLVTIQGFGGGLIVIPESEPPALTISYAEELDPASFRVSLNAEDVTHLFSAVAGPETVILPFEKQRWHKLRIEGRPREDAIMNNDGDPNGAAYHQLHRLEVLYAPPKIMAMPAQKPKVYMRKLTDPPIQPPPGYRAYNPKAKTPWQQ